jgi:preprotein translocase subunit SecE
MQAVDEDVTKDLSMSTTDLPEDDSPKPTRSEDESSPSRTRTRTGGGGGPVQFIRDVRLEMKKVSWPTRNEVVSTVVVVMIAVVFFAAYLWGVDNLLNLFFEQLENWLR